MNAGIAILETLDFNPGPPELFRYRIRIENVV
jgi:hypothetical protein